MDNGEKSDGNEKKNTKSDLSLMQLLKNLNKEKATKEEVLQFEEHVRNKPQLLKALLLRERIDKSNTQTNTTLSFTLAIREGAFQLWRELRGTSPSPLEGMIIDQIVICWANLSDIQFGYQSQVGNAGTTLEYVMYYEKRMDMVQKRLLRAVGMLDKVRRVNMELSETTKQTKNTKSRKRKVKIERKQL